MQITFSQNRNYVLFLTKDHKEYKALSDFPGLLRIEAYHGCPTVLPVAFNLIARVQKAFKNVSLTKEVQDWISSSFQLLPIPDTFKYHTTPKDFQEIALRFLYTLGSAGILLDPGMGKSKVILDYIKLKNFNRSFIVCPAPLLFVWEDEILKHRPELSYYIVKSTDWEEELPSLLNKDVVILNYDKAVILKHRIKELEIDFIHLDEFLIKDPSTNRTKALTEISKGIQYKAGGSGTLINNSPLDMYCPVRYLQPALVGYNYSNFMNRYAVIVQSKTRDEAQTARKVVVGFRNKDEIRSILDSCCIVMTKEKWLKLPPKHFHDIYVPMSEDQRRAYYGLMRNYYLKIGGTQEGVISLGEKEREITVDNPLVMLSKLYQISQGFLYFYKEESNQILADLFADTEKKVKKKKTDREVFFFKEQPKIQALRKLLETTLKDKKCMIWFNLDGEFQLIKALLEEMGESFLSIQGGDSKLGEKVREFNRNPSIKRLACQAKSVNYGITVLGTKKKDLEEEMIEAFPDVSSTVSNQIFYSLNFSLEVFLQQQDRIHRLGQEEECNYYRLFVNNPVEVKLRQTITEKTLLKEEMLIDVATTLLSASEELGTV